MISRYARLQEISERRARKLADSMKFQHFLRDVDEVGIMQSELLEVNF